MARYKVILNPIAGRGLGARIEGELRRTLTSHGLDHELVLSEYPGHAVALAREAALAGYDVVVAAGGDGTCQEIVNGLMDASGGKPTGTLGMIPVGTGSDFARGLGIPPGLGAACRRLAMMQTRTVDIGLVTGPDGRRRYYNNVLGVGFDAVVLVESQGMKWLRGMALYLIAVLKGVFITLRPARAVIEFDGRRIEKTILMFNACNGPREGGGFRVAPDAEQSDGVLDLCIADIVPKLEILRLIPYFMRGTHVTQKPITMARATRVSVTSPDSLVAHADGELLYVDAHRLDIEIVPGCLRVVV